MVPPRKRDWKFVVGQVVVPIVAACLALPIGYELRSSESTRAGPTAYFSPRIAEGPAPLTDSFSTTVTGGTPPYNFTWKFGDGNVSYSPAPTQTYNLTGQYLVQLWVRDSAGLEAHAQSPVVVTLGSELVVYVVGPANATVGSPATFTANAAGGTPPYTYVWEFGDGAFLDTNSNPAVHVYSLEGQFSVNVTVQDSKGGESPSNDHIVNVTTGPGATAAVASLPLWAVGTAGSVVILALLVALLSLRRRRRPPPDG